MLEKIFIFEVLPIEILEVMIDFPNPLGECRHRFIVARMEDVELLGSQQLLEDILVLRNDVIHKAISLPHQTPLGAIVIPAKAFVVFEDGQQFLISKKLAEESQLTNRSISDACGKLQTLDPFIDDVELISFLQESLNLALVIFTRVEATLLCRFHQFRVGAAVGESIRNGIAGITGRKHLASMLVRFSLSELAPINELGSQDERLNKLLDRGQATKTFYKGACQRFILFGFFLGRWTLEDLHEEFLDQTLHDLGIRSTSCLTFLTKPFLPIGHALFNDDIEAGSFLTVLFNRFRNDSHLRGIAWLVDVRLVPIVVFVLLNLLSPLLHVVHHEGDPSLDLAFVVAKIEPLPLALVNEFFKAIPFLLQSPH